ncbi:ABC transporter substrate-binding protein [Cupriavidus sp. AU9028]|uniref:ABC transporter substrate-binding protein n=1 Tax=Cupriavidus sp. AU9028 TaxID=2871157 RepID=UPI00351D1526
MTLHSTVAPSLARRRLLLGLAASGLAPAVLAHSTRAAEDRATSATRTVRVIGPWELSSLDPLRGGYLFSRMQVCETLVEYDEAGRQVPGMAARWGSSADGLEWRFVLRAGAGFHDGTPVRDIDVARALQRALHPAGVLGRAPIQAIRAEGGAVRIVLSRPYGALPALLSHSSTQILAPASFGADGNVRAIVGSGPFRIDTLEPPQRFSVVPFDGWQGARPAVQRASYLSVGRAEMRALMAESGQADLAYGLDPGSIARLRHGNAVRIVEEMIPRTTSLKLNAGHPLLADARARQALSLALDRRGIATAILRDPGLAAQQLFPPVLAGWHDGALPSLTHDPVAARHLLGELGWRLGADGMLWRDGQPFTLTLTTFPDRPELPLIAAAIQEQLRLVGIRVRVAVGNSSEIPFAHRDGSLQMGLIARNYGVVPDAFGAVSQDFGAEDGSGGDWGAMQWREPAVPRALSALSELPARSAERGGESAARALRQRIAGALHGGLPLVPVVWYRQTLAANPRLAGVSIDPFERTWRLTGMRWTA